MSDCTNLKTDMQRLRNINILILSIFSFVKKNISAAAFTVNKVIFTGLNGKIVVRFPAFNIIFITSYCDSVNTAAALKAVLISDNSCRGIS